MVKGFCDADDICYGNMHPKISWDRTKTIGHGDGVCDFKVHIKKN
ncbi:MAG: L-2-amino-thiazoline-4-carboxylic acid hydrolase [Lachnospiraceae bacterium]|nr:L-2-amino-thiazoline-4-carboxylic acid hydrolase [Lachnospiraceae bacterium]